jgi:hypothetical protein
MTLGIVPSDRDVRSRFAASRNADLETRYIIVVVGACCGRNGGRDNNKRYTMRCMVLQYRVERVTCYKYGR